MENAVRLYAIGELLGKDFFIPAYQRGYRWDKQQVIELLDDIYDFANKKNKDPGEFYCLQPIVVRPYTQKLTSTNLDNPGQSWEIVDGQQRLTTLKILFLYLVRVHLHNESFKIEYGKDVFRLHYETRSDTNQFLEAIVEKNGDCIDFHYISQAYSHIREWFELKMPPKSARESVIRTLVGTPEQHDAEGIVRVIWYELAKDENPIESFTRINLGKIPLTSSELIKALFLQNRNFGVDSNEVGKLRQLEIASDWDRIENELQNDDLWWFLNRKENAASARIEFIFDIVRQLARRKDPSLDERTGTDGYATFRFYYQRANAKNSTDFVKQEWAAVVTCFNQLREWYLHPEWYHYVGFLIQCGESVEDLLELYTEPTKNDITVNLKERIAAKLVDKKVGFVEWARDAASGEAYLNVDYGKRELVRRVLLLFNLQEVIRQRNTSLGFARFPFKAFKLENWDIEHIDSFTENPLNNRKDQLLWLTAALHDLPQLGNDDGLLQRIQSFQEDEKGVLREDFHDIQQAIAKLAGEVEHDPSTKNNIGNLTLLDASTNRSYGNALFVTKRRIILENDGDGKFTPPCTKNVFLKYFDQQGFSRTSWGLDDIRAYRNRIATELVDFLPAKPRKK
jgi:Protein of unknown function DUF262/Protein of unknown function (DUF1524)